MKKCPFQQHEHGVMSECSTDCAMYFEDRCLRVEESLAQIRTASFLNEIAQSLDDLSMSALVTEQKTTDCNKEVCHYPGLTRTCSGCRLYRWRTGECAIDRFKTSFPNAVDRMPAPNKKP